MKKIWILAVGALMMAACSNDETTERQQYVADEGEIQLQFMHPGGGETRATETAFENTDQVGVYVTAQDEAL